MKMSEHVFELTNENEFNNFIKQSLVLVDFYADWCMHCITMSPVIEELAKKFKGKIRFAKVDIDINEALPKKYGINTIPTFILFKEGKLIEKFVGSIYIDSFKEKLEKHLK